MIEFLRRGAVLLIFALVVYLAACAVLLIAHDAGLLSVMPGWVRWPGIAVCAICWMKAFSEVFGGLK